MGQGHSPEKLDAGGDWRIIGGWAYRKMRLQTEDSTYERWERIFEVSHLVLLKLGLVKN